MLYTIAVILLVAWLLGFVGLYTIGSFVHVLLVVALVLFVVGPICSLFAGIVGAYLGRNRPHLGRMAFGILVVVSLAIAVISVLVFARVLG